VVGYIPHHQGAEEASEKFLTAKIGEPSSGVDEKKEDLGASGKE